MNGFRKWFGLIALIAIAAVAMPAQATGGWDDPTKIYSLKIAPAAVAAGSSTAMTATFKNEIPSGKSSINSLKLEAPAGLVITAVAKPPSGTATITSGGKYVSVRNMSPVKKGESFVLSLTVSAAAGCKTSTATWDADAWTGSSFGGDKFKLLTDWRSHLKTTITGGCTMVYTTQPTGGLSMGLIGGPVTIEVSPASSFSGKSITLGFASKPSGTATFAAGTNVAQIDAAGVATFPALSITGPAGAYTLSATTGATGYPTATSASFNVAESDGVLDCQGQPNGQPDQFGGNNGVTTVSGNRGLNKDNSTCKLVAYDLSFLGPREVAFVWDTTNQPNAAFAYAIDFAPEFVDPSTGLPRRTKLAWTLTGTTPDYAVGRACLSPHLPTPYGTLGATIGTGDTSISVGPLSPAATVPGAPFPIVIGNERMTVTAVSGTTWTVSRGAGGTTAAAHLASMSVMSTPFPLDAGGVQVRMCVQDEVFVTLAPGKCAPANGTVACVGVSSTVFDAGDGFVSRDF